MGRKKIESKDKKQKLSIAISNKNVSRFEELGVTNRSKLIEWLLENHFNSLGNV